MDGRYSKFTDLSTIETIWGRKGQVNIYSVAYHVLFLGCVSTDSFLGVLRMRLTVIINSVE